VGTIVFIYVILCLFHVFFLFFNVTISFIYINFVFINDKFADRWLQCYLFVAKKIFLKQKSHYSDEFICDVTGQRGSNIIEDMGCARLIGGPPVVQT